MFAIAIAIAIAIAVAVLKMDQSRLKKAFSDIVLWNVEAKGLCAGHREYAGRQKRIQEEILGLILPGERPVIVLTEINSSTATDPKFLVPLTKMGYDWVFAGKDEYAPPPTSDDPDGVMVIYPLEKFSGLKIEAMPHAVVDFEEKGKTKKAGAPWIRISSFFGFYVVLTHLKSKTNCSQVRADQMKKMRAFTGNGKPSFWLTGLIGDLNEDHGTADQTLVTDALVSANMNRNIEHWPKTNMKEAKVLKDAIYANDSRQAGVLGASFSTTDWAFFKGGNVYGQCFGNVCDPDAWYSLYFSDHRPVRITVH